MKSINILRQTLKMYNIPFEDDTSFGIERVKVPSVRECRFSVIQLPNYNSLEMWNFTEEEPVQGLTVHDVITIIADTLF